MREMKDSGIEYIGQIPVNWDVLNLKYLGFTKSGLGNKKPQDFGHGYPFISYKNIYSNFSIDESFEDLVASTESDRENYSVLRGDAFFTGSSETIEELGMASMCLKDITNATYNGFSIRFRPYSLDAYSPEFMMYYFRSLATREHLVRNDNSITRANLSQKLLNMLPVLVPTIEEQEKLATYLDKKVALIYNIIDKTKKSIEEYKKYKQSLITETVTKGLNPDVKMKDSRIEWIGEIPEHWDIAYLTQIYSQVKNKNIGMQESNLMSLSYGKIKRKNINTTDGLLPANFEGYNIIEKGDIVLRLTDLQNDHKSLRVGLAKEKGIITSAYVTLRKKVNVNEEFMYYLLHGFDIYKGFYGMGTGVRQGLTFDGIKSFKFIIPPIEEENKIVNYVINKTRRIEQLIETKEKLLLEIETYKKSLIYEVVTGKKEID
jgi:type I restriction enzyme S subunit